MTNDSESQTAAADRAGDVAAAHRIVATRQMSGGTQHHTCSCGETLDAHPDLTDEAFEFHVGQVTR